MKIVFNGSEYANDIYYWCRREEENYFQKVNYMAKQIEVTESMRKILVDWLITVAHHFRL
jgi:hypothetical protein